MAFQLPKLPFEKEKFEGFISPEGFDYHYGKHHAAYVKNLNAAITDTDFSELSLDAVIDKSFKEKNLAVYNNAAQHFNHSFFWNCIIPNGGGIPTGKISDMINKSFGSFDKFKDEFSTKAAKLFGSGWLWLVKDGEELKLIQMSNAGTPKAENLVPVLTIDVWEHAYYIDHRNARPKFIEKFWDFINWEFVNSNL